MLLLQFISKCSSNIAENLNNVDNDYLRSHYGIFILLGNPTRLLQRGISQFYQQHSLLFIILSIERSHWISDNQAVNCPYVCSSIMFLSRLLSWSLMQRDSFDQISGKYDHLALALSLCSRVFCWKRVGLEKPMAIFQVVSL